MNMYMSMSLFMYMFIPYIVYCRPFRTQYLGFSCYHSSFSWLTGSPMVFQLACC